MRTIIGVFAALLWTLAPTTSWADDQFKLLVIVTPSKYHYEDIPVAPESLEHLGRLHSFGVTWTNDPGAFDGDLR